MVKVAKDISFSTPDKNCNTTLAVVSTIIGVILVENIEENYAKGLQNILHCPATK